MLAGVHGPSLVGVVSAILSPERVSPSVSIVEHPHNHTVACADWDLSIEFSWVDGPQEVILGAGLFGLYQNPVPPAPARAENTPNQERYPYFLIVAQNRIFF